MFFFPIIYLALFGKTTRTEMGIVPRIPVKYSGVDMRDLGNTTETDMGKIAGWMRQQKLLDILTDPNISMLDKIAIIDKEYATISAPNLTAGLGLDF
jgi:hypothetical protein